MTRFFKSAAFPILLVILLAFFVQGLFNNSGSSEEMTFNDFQTAVQAQNVKELQVKTKDLVVEGKLVDSGKAFEIGFTDGYDMIQYLRDNNVDFTTDPQKTSAWASWLSALLPIIIMVVFFIFLMNQMQGGGSKVMSFGKSRAKRMAVDQPKITFKDVAGVDEAVEELEEIKDFLENPKRFQSLGARIPKGVLLFGPPGTGKTLLARAVAGEAGVPFYSISGSDFVEMFVGVGASRVRDLFDQAKQNQPCIIFIDEIDAVGRHRGAGLGGGHDEREQTLNQLLVEMDGFEANESIIIMAATNRPDILDPALLRPGRFDRQIVVDRPDREGRKAILGVHSKGKPLAAGVELDVLAAQTAGFTGADLANLVNEAALLAARRRKRVIEMDELDEAVLRVIAGPERKSRILSDEEKLITAYHEIGHALVAHFLPNADPVHKISIISRGHALGYTITLPTEDKFMVKKKEIMDKLSLALAGRVAEEIRFDDITTGAASDLQRVTETARRMITQYGMSENLGPLTFGHDPAQPFVGRDYGMGQEYSDETAQKIDAEIRRVVDDSYEIARKLLTDHREELDKMSLLLMEQETIDRDEFEALLAGDDPEEVFKARDAARARKAAESKRVQRQRRPREHEEAEPDGHERVATGGVTPMASAGEDQA
ncbi:MAG: cell division protein FtsH [Actinobacteria bacterium RBG_16_64_13]|nr:MAG: cell division protein FtsH [Actinobacteria bacterium RBG_16_64_13]